MLGATGVSLSTDVVVEPGSVVVVDVVVVGASVVVVVVDEVVVGASVVVVVVDEVVVGASVVVVVVDDVVVGASVVVVEVVDVEELVGGVPPSQVCERLNCGLPPLGVISAEEPATWRSVIVDPAGTATKTLSFWPPLGMIEAPLTEYAGLPAPRLRVIDTNAKDPLFGAITKCQYATLVSAGHSALVPA